MEIHIGNLSLSLRAPLKISYAEKKSWYERDYIEFKKQLGTNSEFPLYKNFPILNDKDSQCGTVGLHYFHQDVYVARKIFKNNPRKHVDVGSSIEGFVAHLITFRDIEVFDIRPLKETLSGIQFHQIDITNDLSLPIDYCDSISSLHAIEHFGLGRYGDKIDPYGHLKGFNNISKILKTDGLFYFSVPMGRQRIDFNAHRVFGMPYLLNLVNKDYIVESFAFIDDNNIIHEEVKLTDHCIDTSFGCEYGCAIFELRKL